MIDKIKILIVEDNALIAKGIKSQLLNMGYQIITMAINYEKAMHSIKEEIPDLILLDVVKTHQT
jgi:response regulator of citrate/malate metabolism